MTEFILFRSRLIHNNQLGSNTNTHRGRGSDFSDISIYSSWDDTRDISWRHSARSGNILKKTRIEEDCFPIRIVQTIWSNQLFCTRKNKKSQYEYSIEISQKIHQSATKYHFPIEDIDIVETRELRNTMIFYITTSLDISVFRELSGIAKNNDIIVIHVFHPYELNPDDDLIFDGLSLSKNKYLSELTTKKEQIRKQLIQSHIWYLELTTESNIPKEINRLLKNRI